ncbi:hypothetical protein E2C01_068893 [Portunus trituberculatus]|uniref:Uncharacterized protein n=1 Tax=Portunus trituberculatus TaxID=210409 RepID=A0A5B7HX55_PORTR|nr:hypothetical protein [Portunus trituberculatus]
MKLVVVEGCQVPLEGPYEPWRCPVRRSQAPSSWLLVLAALGVGGTEFGNLEKKTDVAVCRCLCGLSQSGVGPGIDTDIISVYRAALPTLLTSFQ